MLIISQRRRNYTLKTEALLVYRQGHWVEALLSCIIGIIIYEQVNWIFLHIIHA